MHLGQRYLGSKGVPDYIVEDGALGNLAPPADREESASHHNLKPAVNRQPLFPRGRPEELAGSI